MVQKNFQKNQDVTLQKNKMRTVFNNDKLNQEFAENGFVVVPFKEAAELKEIKATLLSLDPSDNFEGNQETKLGKQSFHVTFFDSNLPYKTAMLDYGKQVFEELSQRYLNDYDCAQSNVFLKPAGQGYVYPHQNATIVDETKYVSVSVWMPLQDTDFENGTICLVPGSQTLFEKYRNTTIYWPYVPFFKDGAGLDYFVPVNVKAGEVLILDDRIVHYTPNNNKNEGRWVFHSLWKPKEASTMYCDLVDENVHSFNVENDFWQYHVPGEKMTTRKPDHVTENNGTKYSEDKLIDLLENLSPRASL